MPAPTAPLLLVRGRIALTAVFCAAAFALIVARLVDLTAFHGPVTAGSGDEAKAVALRADLIDRNGALIARDLPVRDLYATPADFWNTSEAAHDLAGVTGADEARLQRAFAAKRGYISVVRALTPDQQNAVLRLGLPGLVFEDSYKRYYPGGRAAVHAVGLADIDGNGVSGLELGLNNRLRQGGKPVQLSLDMRIQYALTHEIEEGESTFQAKAAGGIVLNVHTGEVLALVSLPNFDPSEREPTSQAMRNRMTQDDYELGSIFKIFSFAEAIEENTVNLNENLEVGRPLKLGRYLIHDFEPLGPTLTAAMVFADSSNIGTAQIAMRTPPERQHAFLQRMGLLDAVRTELPESAAPLIPAHWGAVEAATISFGHGISVSPLAFSAAAAAVVNGGTLIVPTFVKRDTPQHGARVLSERTSATMRRLMRLVVTDGTGKQADVPGYDVGGKTGTAEKPHNGGYLRHALISSFCGVFPIDDPQYLVFVMLDEPKGTKGTAGFATAGYTSAPVTGRVIARIAPLLGMPRSEVMVTAEGQRESTKQP
jgi:cell division protein FtsI (penicillin-binding protein 3)